MARRSFAQKSVSKAHNRTMLQALLVQRERLDTVDAGSLARSYGIAEPVVAEMIAAELKRRGVAA